MGSVGPLGVLSLAFVDNPELSGPDVRFLATLAALTAQALERAQVFEHEREALRAAEAARERLSLLSEVTRLLSSSLEPTTVIRRTMSLVEGRLADSCIVQVPGDTGLVRLDVRGPDATGSAFRQLGGEDVPYDSDAPAALAYRTGRTQLASLEFGRRGPPRDVDRVGRAADGQRRGHRGHDLPRRAGPGLRGRRRLPGHRSGKPDRGGPLQRHPVPARARRGRGPPARRAARLAALRSRGSQLDAEYRPGVAGSYAGGDWYDVFELGADVVCFSVGDVMGKGAPAAALWVRSAAPSGPTPSPDRRRTRF